jgi:single-strand DNA-binding protein
MNKCLFTGRLTYDPELKTTTTNKSVASFSIAINEGKNSNGEDLVTFVNCEAWEATANFVTNPQYFKKGKPIEVEGRLRQDRWEDKATGENRSAYKVVVDRINFSPGGSQQENNSVVEEEPTKKSSKKSKKNTVPPAPVVENNESFETKPCFIYFIFRTFPISDIFPC